MTPKLLTEPAVETMFAGLLVVTVLDMAVTSATAGDSYFVVAAFAGGPVSGGAFNPAVGWGATLAKALFGGGNFDWFWVSVIGPLLGGAIAAGIHWVQIVKTVTPSVATRNDPSERALAAETSEPRH
jgi:aquaporin Z